MRAARRQRHPPFAFGLGRSGEDPLCDNFRSPISGQLGISPRMLPEGGRVGVVADAPVAPREAAAPVTRRTYLPGPFQTL